MRPAYERWLMAAIVILFIALVYALRFTVDDAYIAMRYSKNLAEGRGLVYNAGEHVEGFTSPLWVLVLAAAHLLHFNMVTAAQVIGTTLAVLTLLMVYRMADRALPSDAVAGRLVPILFLATSWIYAGWATGGLETALFGFGTALGVSHLQSRVASGATGSDWLPAIGLLIVLTRPEGLLMAAILGSASLFLDFKAGRPLSRTVNRWVGLFVLPLAAIEVARLSYYGKWLPNTFYVKVNKVEYIDRGWPFFVSFSKDSLFYLWGPVALAALFAGDLISACIITYAAIYVAYTIWVGGDWMGYRFYAHLLPLLSFPIAQVIGRMRQDRSPELRMLAIAGTVAMAVVIGVSSYTMYTEGRETRLTMSELDNYQEMDTPEVWAIDVARGLNTILRPGEAASASFAGFTALYTNHTVVDSLGLTDAYVASLPAVRGGPGHEKFAPPEYLRSRNVLLVNPWPGRDLAESNRRFVAQYSPGDYLFFDALEPPARVAAILTPRGFGVWADGQKLFDRSAVENLVVDLNLDFERGTWDDWTLSGTAFGTVPGDASTWANSPHITGVQGRYFVNTYTNNNDAALGTARSRDFTIDGDVIHFLIAGGASQQTALELWVDGQRVRTTSGRNSEDLIPLAWDVAQFRGRMGYLLIRDDNSSGWGHIVVDDINVARTRSKN